MELIGAPYRAFYGTVLNLNEAAVYLWATIYFWQIDKNWFPLIAFGYSLAAISTIFIYFFPESPVYLVNKGLFGEAKKSLDYIAKINGQDFKFDEDYFAKADCARFSKFNTQLDMSVSADKVLMNVTTASTLDEHLAKTGDVDTTSTR